MSLEETLDALDKRATQGEWEICAYYTGTGPDERCHGLVVVDDFPNGIIDEEGATAESLSPNLEFIVTLVNAYRTGQLVVKPGMALPKIDLEACAEAVFQANDTWDGTDDHDERLALAVIRLIRPDFTLE